MISKLSNNTYKLTDPRIFQEIQKLREIDTKVKAHELAHEAAGGSLASPPHYKKVKGPDGKEYAVAGDVQIRIQKGKTPQETINNMKRVIAAALAPANPSPQDLRVAQRAQIIMDKAEEELHQKKHIDLLA